MKANLTIHPRLRLSFSPLVWALLVFMGLAALLALYRYAFGVGAISNLSNAYPWGFWVSFDRSGNLYLRVEGIQAHA
jgi:Ni/Fe-hydrogenase subunit HybB-like protein